MSCSSRSPRANATCATRSTPIPPGRPSASAPPTRRSTCSPSPADARAAIVALVEARLNKKLPVRGFESDDAARAVATKAGFGNRVLRPTGHSLDTRRFGEGPTFDDAIDHDDRQLLPRTGYVVEPLGSTSPAPSACASPSICSSAPTACAPTPNPAARDRAHGARVRGTSPATGA